MLYEIEGEPSRVLERGAGYLTDEARVEDRIGGGHAEGLFEAWSNLYARFAVAMADADKGAYGDFWYPDVKAGSTRASSGSKSAWNPQTRVPRGWITNNSINSISPRIF